MHNIKIVVCGDGAVGKTSMLISYTTNSFPIDHVPTVFDNYSSQIILGGENINLGLWDTAGQSDYDSIRPLSYPQTSVFLICFAVDNIESFENVKRKWVPEVTSFCPDVPFFVIGTKADKRISGNTNTTDGFVSVENAEKAAKELNASKYMECSALSQNNLRNVFEQAINCVLDIKKPVLENSCCVII